MKAVVQLGQDYPGAPEPLPELTDAAPVSIDMDTYYGGGLTFHGPSLQGMTDAGVRSLQGASATFHTKPDSELLGHERRFALDPLLLDTATHPMWSGEPQIWVPGLAHGKLAYPVACEALTLHGPRPSGAIRCELRTVSASEHALCFDVQLIGSEGVWCSFRWTETLVDGGPVLGQPTALRKAFMWEAGPCTEVRIGRATEQGHGWQVLQSDLVEPIEGTLGDLYCTERERRWLRESANRSEATVAWIAAKEAVRQRCQQLLGRDVHPTQIELLRMRPDLFVVIETPSLTAQEYIDTLGPTRFDLWVQSDEHGAVARFESHQ